jgi:hypothetical protein
VVIGSSIFWDTTPCSPLQIQGPGPPGWELEARLSTLLCKEIIDAKCKEVQTGSNMAESLWLKSADLPMMLYIMPQNRTVIGHYIKIVQAVCRSGGYSPASHCECQVSIPGQVLWDLWCKKWHWGRFTPSTSVSRANLHPTNCFTFINHPIWSRVRFPMRSLDFSIGLILPAAL